LKLKPFVTSFGVPLGDLPAREPCDAIIGRRLTTRYSAALTVRDTRHPHTHSTRITNYIARAVSQSENFIELRQSFHFGSPFVGSLLLWTLRPSCDNSTNSVSYAEKEIPVEQMEERKAAGFIRPSMSGYGAPVIMPQKKDECGNWTLKRPCCNYCMLNKVSVTDRYVLPTHENIFDNIKDAGVYTTLDLRLGFYQVRVAEEMFLIRGAFW
jgi:hypothetical protein